MALISCSECGKDVSSLAKACPNCGCPVAASIPKEPFKLTVNGGSIEVNRSASEVTNLLLTSAENLGLRSHLDGRYVQISGKSWRHGGTVAEFNLTQDPEKLATKLAVQDVSGKVFSDGYLRKLIDDLLIQIQEIAT